MSEGRKVYHVCNKSSNVIFRLEDDYFTGILKLVIAAIVTDTTIIAYAFMSTHFHFIVESSDVDKFIGHFKKIYTMKFNYKYGNQGKIFSNITSREIHSNYELKIAINYVLKNPVHHNVCDVAFSYRFSSILNYFPHSFLNSDLINQIKKGSTIKSFNELSYEIRRELFGRMTDCDWIKVRDDKYVVPSSFLDINKVKEVYGNGSAFIYHMNRPLSEEYKAK